MSAMAAEEESEPSMNSVSLGVLLIVLILMTWVLEPLEPMDPGGTPTIHALRTVTSFLLASTKSTILGNIMLSSGGRRNDTTAG